MRLRLLIVPILFLVAGVVVFLLSDFSPRQKRPTAQPGQSQSLEEKLTTLKSCGLQLTAPFTVNDLLKSVGREKYEQPGYETVLVGLGGTEEKEPWRNLSTNLWHFDTECIEDDGSYKQLAERMVQMTQGSLVLENIKDHVDVEKEEAWLSFTFRGKPMKFDLKVRDDWADPAIFGKFVEMLKQSDSSKIYLYHDLSGQDCLIACVTRTEFDCLTSMGIEFEPLN